MALAEALYKLLKESEWSEGSPPDSFADLYPWWQHDILTVVDLAGSWIADPNERRNILFTGWIFNLKHDEYRPAGNRPFSIAALLPRTKLCWMGVLDGKVPAAAVEYFGREWDRFSLPLSINARAQVKALFIGDCFMQEVIACLNGWCVRAQIALEATLVNQHLPASIRQDMRKRDPSAFDIVFYSPFSYTFAPEYGQIIGGGASLWSRAKLFGVASSMLDEVRLTVQTLAAQFSCPIYVHNTAGIVQSFEPVKGLAKNLFSYRSRRNIRELVRQRIDAIIVESTNEGRVRLMDEESARRRASDFALGRVLFQGSVFHPTLLSTELACGPYLDVMASTGLLATKKIVVCDLDETLWSGVIGEGQVQHFVERQQILKALRNRGVLLSINSKNDPANVELAFAGSVLQLDDFVAPQINWEPKPKNMVKIVEELNIKEKDFIFIDDRPDELERIRNAFPAMVVLDAREQATWRWLAHWERHLPTDQLEDRTRLYHERAAREQFLGGKALGNGKAPGNIDDEATALSKLQLSVRIERATGKSELKRVVELINRTNQFNLCGSRVTLAELERGLGVDQWVLTAAARDKFGSMGIVAAALVKRKTEGLEIPVFVLSCRVFGFGIEFALLNALRELLPNESRLTALYRQTQHNGPCRDFYAKAGLQNEGAVWAGNVSDLTATPAWLALER